MVTVVMVTVVMVIVVMVTVVMVISSDCRYAPGLVTFSEW